MGVEEWRIPVGRAETTRKGEREEEGAADDDHGNNTRKRERGEEERERRDQGRCNAQKMGGEGTPIDVGTGEATWGQTGRQKIGRNECRRSQKGRMREVCRHIDGQNG